MNGGTLRVDLGGAEDFGHVEASGIVQLEGVSVEARLSNGFIPSAGDSFVLLSTDGEITGAPMLGGTLNPTSLLEWDLDVDPHQVTVSAMPALDGDYNANGVVDAADYIVWRKLLDQTGPGLVADGDDNNVVNAADYDVWRVNFGRAIPEPATALLLLASYLLPLGRWQNR